MKWIDWAWNTLLVAIVLSLALSIHQVRADSWSERNKVLTLEVFIIKVNLDTKTN